MSTQKKAANTTEVKTVNSSLLNATPVVKQVDMPVEMRAEAFKVGFSCNNSKYNASLVNEFGVIEGSCPSWLSTSLTFFIPAHLHSSDNEGSNRATGYPEGPSILYQVQV